MAELKANWSEGEGEVKNEDVQVAILANLQQIQDQEAEILLKDLSSKVSAWWWLRQMSQRMKNVSYSFQSSVFVAAHTGSKKAVFICISVHPSHSTFIISHIS